MTDAQIAGLYFSIGLLIMFLTDVSLLDPEYPSRARVCLWKDLSALRTRDVARNRDFLRLRPLHPLHQRHLVYSQAHRAPHLGR